MAAQTTPLAPSARYEWSRVGAEFERKPSEILPKQVPFLVGDSSGTPVVTSPVGPVDDSSPAQSARPRALNFGALNDPVYRLRKPVPLEVSVEESHVVVAWSQIDEFGVGETLSDAIFDFARSLRELNRGLRKSQELGPDLVNVRDILAEYIEPRP